MTQPAKARCHAAATWVRGQLGRGAFAPFTGQDWRAYEVWVHALELYFGADQAGQRCALTAMRAALGAMQPKCWDVAKATIPAVADWSDEERVWRMLHPQLELVK